MEQAAGGAVDWDPDSAKVRADPASLSEGRTMRVLSDFGTGVPQPFDLRPGEIAFDLRPGQRILHVLLEDAPPALRVRLRADEKGAEFLRNQGMYSNRGTERYEVLPLTEPEPGHLVATLPAAAGDTFVATRIPYGRDNLDRLLVDTRGADRLSVRLLGSRGRQVPVFVFGTEGRPPLAHWFICGKDAWETAGSWVGDGLVRELSEDAALADRVLNRAAIYVVPLASPHSAGQPAPSYTAADGRSLYGAATWSDDPPPPEYALIRNEVIRAVQARRLGLLLTVHSWQGAREWSGLEFVRTAGDREITGARLEWAKSTLDALIRDVPRGRADVAEAIWHPGLARDHLLAAHDAITFRIEITTVRQSYDGFRQTARRLLENTASIDDWAPAL
jgi:hypothetical protein